MTIQLSSVSWILLMILISIYSSLLFGHHVVVCGQCLRDQQSLLLQLKDTLDFDTARSKILVQWNGSSDCCSWPGISCDEEGRVTELKLSEESIFGGIDNSTLFNLAYLESLDLSLNYFDSTIPSRTIPSRIGNLTNLSYLNFSHAGFEGKIPREISSLKRLVTLDLSFGFYPFDEYDEDVANNPEIPNMRKLVENITKLEELYLDGVTVLAPGGNEWAMALSSSLPNLRVLSLSRCYLSGPIHQSLDLSHNSFNRTLPDSITNLTQLVHLDLSANNFSGTLPDSITNLTQLVHLHLSYNSFDGTLPDSITNLTQLVHLDLSYNSFSGTLPDSITNLTQLVHLDLSSNNFSGTLPDSITNLTQLVHLDLSHNSFDGTLPDSITNLTQLVHLDLSYNSFDGTLPDSITNLTQLVHLDLSHNSFDGTLPDSITNPTQLVHLDLSSNNFSGTLPDSITNLTQLVHLYLSFNSFDGTLPDSITNLTQLVDVDLSFNNFTGPIPSFHMSKNLTTIYLSNNRFIGRIPSAHWEGLSNLVDVNLRNNSLSGNIPSSLFAHPSLEIIDLSYNQFSGQLLEFPNAPSSMLYYIDLSSNKLQGTIPMSIFKLRNLGSIRYIKVLDLSNNSLSGPIPDAFPVDCNLEILNVNGNSLTDKIPKSLGNCNALRFLNLGNNQMVDTFPLLLKNISTLRVLVLRSNKLHGHITCRDNIGDWPEIQIVDVASNNFSGQLPSQCLTKWHAMMVEEVGAPYERVMSYEDAVTVTNKRLEMELVTIPEGFSCIDFSKNNFHGEIPKELGLLNSLIVLNLSNNALSGHIPSSFGNLTQLESLDLAKNHLNGEIPASLSNLNFLEVLNLSYNRLSGRIPTGPQIQTFSADCFQNNEGLCGPPLTPNCRNDRLPKTPDHGAKSSTGIKWDLISVEVGFVVGFGTVIAPLVFSRRWRKCYFDHVEDIAFWILPQLLLKKWVSWKYGNTKTKGRGIRVGG